LCSPTSALDLELVGDVLAVMRKLAAAWQSAVVAASDRPGGPAADQVAWTTWWMARASFATVGSEVR
jgi:ABC-type histidine transport system ATPase subunit